MPAEKRTRTTVQLTHHKRKTREIRRLKPHLVRSEWSNPPTVRRFAQVIGAS